MSSATGMRQSLDHLRSFLPFSGYQDLNEGTKQLVFNPILNKMQKLLEIGLGGGNQPSGHGET